MLFEYAIIEFLQHHDFILSARARSLPIVEGCFFLFPKSIAIDEIMLKIDVKLAHSGDFGTGLDSTT